VEQVPLEQELQDDDELPLPPFPPPDVAKVEKHLVAFLF